MAKFLLQQPFVFSKKILTKKKVIQVAMVHAGIPRNINSGVIRKPPPIPKTPDRKPTAAPSARRTNKSTGTSAIGRKICIGITFLSFRF